MKKITIINGAPDESYLDFEQAINSFLQSSKDIAAEVFNIRDMNINFCVGCWDCWVKTPGLCRHKDDMPVLLRSIINSDLCIFVSPVQMGFVSSYIKKINDKMIPLVHPYVGICEDEFHHLSRYKHYPQLGFVMLDRMGQGQESLEIITEVYRRMAINLKTKLAFSVLTDGQIAEVQHAINNS